MGQGRGGGPKTPAGKAIVSQNAVRHGVFAQAAVLPLVETQEEWELHRAGIIESLAPVGLLEITLADRIAVMLWRQARLVRYERDVAAADLEEIDRKISERRRGDHYESEFGVWPHDIVSAADDLKEQARFLRTLADLPDEEPMRADFADGMLWSIAGKVGVDLEETDLPDVPQDADLSKLEWTVGWFRRCLATIFEQADRDQAEFMRQYSIGVSCEEVRATTQAEQVQREQTREQGRHQLPNFPTLEVIARYESHLSREGSKALREFQELQDRRLAREARTPQPSPRRANVIAAERVPASLNSGKFVS